MDLKAGYVLLRDVTVEECPWLSADLKKGQTVYLYPGCDYGCCTDEGTACTHEYNVTPFFEVPNDALGI